MTLEEAFVSVWRQALADRTDTVELVGQSSRVRATPRKRLRQVDFTFKGRSLHGLEQNPGTRSRWAEMARSGAKAMQFLEAGRYVRVVVDG